MKKTILMLAMFGLIVGLTSCSKPEEVTVSKYFQAMGSDDKDTLTAMAIEPKAFKFKSFKIEKIEPGETKDLELPAMEQKLADLEKERTAQQKVAVEKTDAFDEFKDEVGENPKGPNAAKYAEFENAAKVEKDKFLAISREVGAMKKNIELEKSIITASASIDKDFEIYTGQTIISKVFVKVTMANDEVKDYVFLLRKNVMKQGEGGREVNGRIVILKIGTPEEIANTDQPSTETPAKPADGTAPAPK